MRNTSQPWEQSSSAAVKTTASAATAGTRSLSTTLNSEGKRRKRSPVGKGWSRILTILMFLKKLISGRNLLLPYFRAARLLAALLGSMEDLPQRKLFC